MMLLGLGVTALFGAEKKGDYLALGDSVSFGYDPTVTNPAPAKFTGYPERVTDFKKISDVKKEINASCPGQSSTSFLIGGFDIGCEAFKANVGLHVNYSGTQVQYAVTRLRGKDKIELVTLSIGGNDLSLLQGQCATAPDFAACVGAGLPGVLNVYAGNLTQILSAIRVAGDYDGKLVLVLQYTPSADPLFAQAVAALNSVMKQVGTPFGAKFADGFSAFRYASIFSGGDPCKAGLLVRLSPTACDIHPSPAGRDLLAALVIAAANQR